MWRLVYVKKTKADHSGSKLNAQKNRAVYIDNFRSKIQLGPCHICIICNRCFYKKSVKFFHKSKSFALAKLISTNVVSPDGHEYICKTCSLKVSKNKIPCQAVFNKLNLADIPFELGILNKLECAIITKRLLFKKIVIMSKGQMPKRKGAISNCSNLLCK